MFIKVCCLLSATIACVLKPAIAVEFIECGYGFFECDCGKLEQNTNHEEMKGRAENVFSLWIRTTAKCDFLF